MFMSYEEVEANREAQRLVHGYFRELEPNNLPLNSVTWDSKLINKAIDMAMLEVNNEWLNQAEQGDLLEEEYNFMVSVMVELGKIRQCNVNL